MLARKQSKFRALEGLRHVDLDDGDAFVADFRHGFVPVKDGDAEAMGEEFIAAATSGEGIGEAARDELVDEELDGPAVEMSFEELLDEYIEPVGPLARKAS